MVQTGSFIPKQTTSRPVGVRRRKVYIISYVVYAIFTTATLTAVAMFVWHWQLENTLASEQARLAEERVKFNQSDIVEVLETKSLLAQVAYLLANQPALSKLLAALEESTVETIQLRNFTVQQETTNTEANATADLLVSYKGSADSLNTVLAQRKVLKNSTLLGDAEITQVAYSASGENDGTAVTGYPISYEVTIQLPVSSVVFEGLYSSATTSTTQVTTETVDTAINDFDEVVSTSTLEDVTSDVDVDL